MATGTRGQPGRRAVPARDRDRGTRGRRPGRHFFIHGGLANRGFWDHELAALAANHRVIAPDLPGHGESGANRKKWGIPQFGADVRAVIEAEHVRKVIIFGNSTAPAARRLRVPLRAINGDRFPTDIDAIRKVHADFDAVIMKHMGHYPMLERPDEFDRLVTEMVSGLTRRSTR